MSKIKKLLEEGVLQKHFPGAHFGIVYKDKFLNSDFIGYKQIYPNHEKLKGDEIYDVASLTKVVSTTTLILKLIENQDLTFNTKVSDIIDWFKHEEITIYDLLTHTSGLPADIPRANTLRDKADVIDKIRNIELKADRGQHIIYSDIGYILLGFIIEKLTRQSLNSIGQSWIFKPLGMVDTSYEPDLKRVAPTEVRDDDVYKGLLCGKVHDEKAYALGGAGHAGLFSTVNDLLVFAKAILDNKFVLSKEYIDMLFTLREEKPSLNGNILKRAYGWDKPTPNGSSSDDSDFDETILHTGFTGCNMFIDRRNQIAFVMLSNAVHPKRSLNQIIGYRNQIAQMIYKYREENTND